MTEADARSRLRTLRAAVEGNALAAQVYMLAAAVISEQDAEIDRLHEEMAVMENRSVLHATGAQCERIITLRQADTEPIGTLLRSTDDRRVW